MTKLPPPAQWVLSKMTELEVAEMIEKNINYYTVDKDGSERSVHLATHFADLVGFGPRASRNFARSGCADRVRGLALLLASALLRSCRFRPMG